MFPIIAHPSEKGGYNQPKFHYCFEAIIAHPSEKGGYNAYLSPRWSLAIIAHPSEKGGYNYRYCMNNETKNYSASE